MKAYKKFLLKNNKIKILEKLKNNFNIISKQKHTVHLIYYDTFNAKLFLNNYYLIKNETVNRFILYNFKENTAAFEDDTKNDIKCYHDLKNSEMKAKLKEIIKERIILELVKMKRMTEEYCVENEEKKITVKLSFERNNINIKNKNRLAGSYLIIKKLRGYEKEYNSILKFLTNENLKKADEKILLTGLKKIKHPAIFYFSKSRYIISKKTSVYNSTRLILSHYLIKLQLNEAGIINDTDTEFLHDYRVTLRLLRSYLPVLKELYDKKIIKKIKSGYKLIMNTTNMLRDIDVFLLNLENYKKYIDEKYHNIITHFSEYLIKIRKDEHYKVKIFLNSSEYKNIISFLKTLIRKKITRTPVKQQIFSILKKNISILKKDIFKCRNKINYISIEKQMHKLRICFKKLRYFISIFKELFPEKIILPLIADLKKIQDSLGELNDLQVQENLLKIYSSTGIHMNINIAELISYLNNKKNILIKTNLKLLNKTINNNNFKRLYLFIKN